jgi:predicted RND superfamily exporter protein
VELRDILAQPQTPIAFGEEAVMTEAEDIQEQLAQNRAMLADEVDRLWANIVEIQALSIIGGQDRVVEKTTQLIGTRETRDAGMLRVVADNFLNNVEAGPESAFDWNSLNRFATAFEQKLRPTIERMAQGDTPVTVEMMPQDILARYVSKAGEPPYLMQITPKQNLYEREELELFQEVMSKIAPNITGMPQMIITMSLETIREGKLASFLAVTLILGLLLFDFRKTPLVAGLAFLPLICGTALMLGVMWLFGEKFNYVNMIALPVIIGIGVDDGVHFFHRLLHEGKGGLRRSATSVGRAMLMTSLTTMIGFGSLMFYMMEGMKSMGFALFVGVGLCFIVTVTLLPALSVLFEKWIIKEKVSTE